MSKEWYAYDGRGDINIPASYFRINVKPSCFDGLHLCAIYVTDGAPNPAVLSANVRQYIFNSLATSRSQPDVEGEKKYVYLKG
jgi:hypothetical protein